jgi:cytochrome c
MTHLLLHAALGLGALLAGLPAAQAQSGDAQRGRGLFESRCGGCHSLDENRVGPALGSVVGRAAGKKADFAYSAALAAATHVWTPDKLQAWLTDPEALVPGQAMGYRLSEAADRRDVVAFLQSLAAGQPAR